MRHEDGAAVRNSHLFIGVRPLIRSIGLALLLGAIPTMAWAHVKWFASWDIICPPRDPIRVLASPLWRSFFGAGVVTMAILAALDAYLTLCGGRLQAMRGSVHDVTMKHALLVLRVGLAIYWALVAF